MTSKSSSLQFTVLMIALIFHSSLLASEIDPFRLRATLLELSDMSAKINHKSNEYLQEALKLSNQSPGCRRKTLYRNLRKFFRNHIIGELAPYIINSPEIERLETRTSQSIYRDFRWYEAVIPGFYARYFSDPAGKILNLNGHLLGTDKFEHFMGTGYKYFKRYQKDQSIETLLKILKKGERLETGFMGSLTTGVKSYGDMVANFNGMRFWNHMLGKHPDILGQEIAPYVVCENNYWRANNPIDWRFYVDAAWDEGINCSKLRTESMLAKVEGIIEIYQRHTEIDLTCPMNLEVLMRVIDSKYAPLPAWTHEYLFNTKGLSVVD